jgi:type IV pilus assembly protein PilY1
VGNVKKYKINSDGDVLDANDNVAIEPATGYFKTDAQSYWGGIKDGPVVAKSGTASQFSNERKILTVSGDATASNINLNTTANIIALDNDLITDELYGLDPDNYADEAALNAARQKLIKWIIGVDVDDDDDDDSHTDANNYMADPLHSRPIVVTYDGTDDDNTTDILFATTNSGAFHAINTSNGQELFAFIPQDLLPNQLDYFTDDPDGVRRYGLDGPMTVWRKESNDDDVKIESADGDHVYAYFGMRRGGDNYYALDVTSTTNPKLMWTIFGGDPGFKDMGQSWSRPILRQVNWGCNAEGENCTLKDVLFFAGGYDTIHDNATAPTTGDQGAAIYMVDAKTGSLLWSAGNNDDNTTGDDTHDLNLPMTNSIPGDVTVADMDGDGAADVLFAIDIQGHVWRIDFNSATTSASDFAQDGNGTDTGAEIADLSDSGQFRRFYTGPVVSLSQKRGREPFFVISMGSGYTAHPKDTDIVDRLYALFEYNIFGPPQNGDGDIEYTTIDNDSLLNLTNPANGPADPATNAPHGFYKNAGTDGATGEKFLRPALTLFGYTLYTSYLPEGNGDDVDTSCGAEYLGGGRLYAMDFVTGESAYTGEYLDLKHPGIPPQPVALFIPDTTTGTTKTILCVGTECFSPDDEENPWDEVTTQILYWRENTQ